MKQYINYWTELGIASKKALYEQKIQVKNSSHRRHPKLSELTFESKSLTLQNLSKEEWKKRFKEEREKKKEKLENLPFSSYHQSLVNNLYGKADNSLKKNALIAAHEERIRSLIIKRSIQRSLKAIGVNKNKPNLLIINTEYDWKISTFMAIPSSHDLDTLFKIGKDMADKLSKSMKNFFSVEIWTNEAYMDKLAGGISGYRYRIGKSK